MSQIQLPTDQKSKKISNSRLRENSFDNSESNLISDNTLEKETSGSVFISCP